MTKTAFISGVTAGIGEAAARRFAGAGWQVIGTGRRQDRLDALAAELGGALRTIALDMRDLEAVEARRRAPRQARPAGPAAGRCRSPASRRRRSAAPRPRRCRR